MTWTGNHFVAVRSAGTVLTSSDGIIWTQGNTGITNILYSVTSTNSLLVAVGEDGIIITSPVDPVVTITPLSTSQNRLQLHLTQSDIFFTPPSSLLFQSMSATVYTLSGHKVAVSQTMQPSTVGEFQLPINHLARGAYLFELKSAGRRFTRTFSITR